MESRPQPGLSFLRPLRASLLAAIGIAACSSGVDTTNSSDQSSSSSSSSGGSSGSSSSGSSSSGSSSTGSSSSSSGALCGGAPACAGAKPILAGDGKPSGFWSCADNTIQRMEPVTCDPNIGIMACTGAETSKLCTTDADCTDKPHGHCGQHTFIGLGGAQTDCTCIYPCIDDSECGPGATCVCGGVTQDHTSSFCANSACKGCVDCPSGVCGVSVHPNGCETLVTLACRSDTDKCHNDADCAAIPNTSCVLFDASSDWTCLGTTCATARAPLATE